MSRRHQHNSTRRVLKRDPEERIAVDEFFRHPWLDLDAYQGSIVIGPDDEPEGISTGKLCGRGIFMNCAGHCLCLSLHVWPIATQEVVE
jgi:hypothetical protein